MHGTFPNHRNYKRKQVRIFQVGNMLINLEIYIYIFFELTFYTIRLALVPFRTIVIFSLKNY